MHRQANRSTLPLAGLRVVDFSRLAPGPMATMYLADLGADVVKIEQPGGSRREREERALTRESETEGSRWRQLSPLERNKRSIAINLQDPAGKELAVRLIETADVLVEGYRPGVMSRLGLGYDSVRLANPRLIYCSLTGYGQAGAKAGAVGHDLNYLAYSGALSLIGDRSGAPIVPINLLGDYAGGSLMAVIGILTALLERLVSGEGQFVDVSMTDSLVALLAVEVARLLHTGRTPKARTTYLTGGVAYYNVYQTKDDAYITVACNEPQFFRDLCATLELEDLPPLQFVETAQDQIASALAQRFRERTLTEWMTVLDDSRVPVSGVRSLDQVLADEDLRKRGMIVAVPSKSGPATLQVGCPIHLSRTPALVDRLAPMVGADTRALMHELAYDADTIQRMVEAGIVAEPLIRPKHQPGA